MLRLHETLSESLYQNKDDRSNEKLSVKIVFLITLLGCLIPLSWDTNQDFLHSVLFPLLYSVLVWLLPCCLFVMGVKKRSPFLLLPWILVSCVLGMVAEMFLFWAAVSCLSPNPPLELLGSPGCDLPLLLVLAVPLPVLLTVPIRAYVYMDRQARRSEPASYHFCCYCCKRGDTVKDDVAQEREDEDESDETESQDAETAINSRCVEPRERLISEGGVINSIIITSMAAPPVSSLADRALEALMGRSSREARDLTEEEWGERIEEERRRVMMVEAERARMARTAQLDLFDLSGIRTEQRLEEIVEVEGGEQGVVSSNQHLDPLPPSYSLAEGLDQLPDYKQAEVNRVKIGPYVMVYDKQNKNLSTFKK